MATKQLNTRIVLRNDTAARWSSENPVLRKGEIGIVFDPSVEDANYVVDFKVGDGVKTWNQLPLFRGNIGDIVGRVEALETAVATHTTQISGLEGRMTDAESAITALQSAASSYATHGEVQAAVEAEETRAKNVENELSAAITANAAAISINAGAITNINSTIVDLKHAVDVNSVTAAIAAAQTETLASANTAAQGYVSAGLASLSTIYLAASYSVSIASHADAIDTLNATAGVAGSVDYKVAAEASRAQGVEQALDARIDVLEGNHFIIAQPTGEDRHPDVQDPVANAIYLVPKAEGQGYCEWLHLQVSEEPATYRWEEIGDTNIDLSDYATKAFVTASIASAVAGLATQGEVAAVSNALASEVSRATGVEAALDERLDAIEEDYLTQADSYILDCGNAQTNIN